MKITLALPSSEKATLRFPTDDELCDRSRKQRAIQQNLGRGKTKTEIKNYSETNEELFDRILLHTDATLDDAEKSALVGKLLRAEVLDLERIGAQVEVTLDTIFPEPVKHVVNIPRERDVVKYNRSTVSGTDSQRFRELRFSLEPAAELYDKMRVSESGFAEGSAIPIYLKAAVVSAVLQELREADDQVPEIEALGIG